MPPPSFEGGLAFLPHLGNSPHLKRTMPRSQSPAGHYVALASFRYVLRKFLAFCKRLLSVEVDLTPEQYEALLALEAFGKGSKLTVGELSERLQVKHHTTVALTQKLVVRGLVTKERGAREARHVHVKLSPSGRKLLKALAFKHHNKLVELREEMLSALRQLGGKSQPGNTRQ